MPPIRDRAGNVLLDVRAVGEDGIDVTASLVVVTCAGAVLMVLDSWRRQWELPGGMVEPGEGPRAAAERELREETGLRGVDLSFAVVAEFDLVEPVRHELLAVYRVRLPRAPELAGDDEVLGFRWWSPEEAVPADMSPLDAEIARRVLP